MQITQLALQFVASIYYLNRHHDLETLGPNDSIREVKPEEQKRDGACLTAYCPSQGLSDI